MQIKLLSSAKFLNSYGRIFSILLPHQNQQREFTLRQAKEMEKDAKQRLGIQRQEYEAAIQRHLSFIDQLIDDKKVLSERCEELVTKLKSTDKKYGDKIKQMEEGWVCRALDPLKESWRTDFVGAVYCTR